MKYSADDLARFWPKVDAAGECWTWTAGISAAGYGAFWHSGQMQKAHRVSYELEHGTIRADRLIDHTCHNRRCVRPSHLREVTNKQNVENHTGPKATSKSGVRGVVWVKDCNKWGVYVRHNGKSMYFGVYESIVEAEQVAIKTRNRLFSHNDLDRRAA